MLIYHKKNPDTLMMAGFFYGRLIATVNEPIAKTVYTRFYATMNTLSIS